MPNTRNSELLKAFEVFGFKFPFIPVSEQLEGMIEKITNEVRQAPEVRQASAVRQAPTARRAPTLRQASQVRDADNNNLTAYSQEQLEFYRDLLISYWKAENPSPLQILPGLGASFLDVSTIGREIDLPNISIDPEEAQKIRTFQEDFSNQTIVDLEQGAINHRGIVCIMIGQSCYQFNLFNQALEINQITGRAKLKKDDILTNLRIFYPKVDGLGAMGVSDELVIGAHDSDKKIRVLGRISCLGFTGYLPVEIDMFALGIKICNTINVLCEAQGLVGSPRLTFRLFGTDKDTAKYFRAGRHPDITPSFDSAVDSEEMGDEQTELVVITSQSQGLHCLLRQCQIADDEIPEECGRGGGR